MFPEAQQEKLLVHEVGDELVIYDQERQHAHRLNRTAALLWRHCDGETSIAALAAVLARELGLPADESLVWLTLDQLDKSRLLRERMPRKGIPAAMTRRQLVRRLGLTGALAVLAPVVRTIAAPAPATAQSLEPGSARCCRYMNAPGGSCGTLIRCTSGQSCDGTANGGCPAPVSGCAFMMCANVTGCTAC